MISQAEQYLLELVNRARLDPQAEADRYGIDLNQGLNAATITSDAKQVLAPNEKLELASQLHSLWMLDTNVFSHTGDGGSTLRQRAEAAGYTLSGSWRLGENIAWSGTTGTLNLAAQIDVHHQGLFLSSGHRQNLLDDHFREIGIAQEAGQFLYSGQNYDASMLTEKFGKSGSNIFITGVVYDDLDEDYFFSVGEGRSNATFTVRSASSVSADAGGYSIAVSPRDAVTVSISYQGFQGSLSIMPEGENTKVDLVDGERVLLSKSATLLTGIAEATLLGIEDIDLQGSMASDVLTGNSGDNVVIGASGNDVIYGGDGNDLLNGGLNNDRLLGGEGVDTLNGGDGDDVLIDRVGATNTFNGGAGEDRVVSGDGIDIVSGGSERDVIKTYGGADEINGDGGDDVILSGDGHDIVYGGDNDDVIKTGLGNDTVYGGEGNDIIYGWRGDDELYGGAGDDVIRGDFDGDIIEGGAGNDRLVGAPGRDTFIFRDGFEEDRILDFTDRSDLLDFSQHTGVGSIDDLSITQVSTNVVITDGDGGRVVLANTDIADISETDFIFSIA